MTPVDPSWLASTVAQSTAALVGIVGGLLVGRFIGLDAEQRAADLRVTEAHERLAAARETREQLTAQVQARTAQGVLSRRAVTRLIVERRGEVEARDVLTLPAVHTDLDEGALAPHLRSACTAAREAFDQCEARLPETEEGVPQWDAVRAALNLPYDCWDGIREGVFKRVAEDKRRAAVRTRQEAERAARAERARAAGPLGGIFAGYEASMGAANAGLGSEWLSGDLVERPELPVLIPAGLQQRLGDVEVQLQVTELELVQAERAVQRSRTPPGLLLAVSVLTVLTLVGLVWPVFALYLEPAYSPGGPGSHRLWVFCAFVGGLILLLTYLWGYAWRLTRHRRTPQRTPAEPDVPAARLATAVRPAVREP